MIIRERRIGVVHRRAMDYALSCYTLFALLVIALSITACEDKAQTVRDANQTPVVSTATAEIPTPSAEIRATELEDGDCVNSTLPEGISVDTVVIVPCSGDWQYRVLNSFQVADAEAHPDETVFSSQVAENCDRQTTFYLLPSAQSWEQGDRTVTCLQQATELLISDLLEGLELNVEDLSEDEASCLEEWVASDNFIAFMATPEDPAEAEEFAVLMMISCFPDQLIAAFVSGFGGLTLEDLSDEELDCARKLVAGIDVDAFLAGPEDSAEYTNGVAAVISCIPDQLIATFVSGFGGLTLEDLSDEELDCARKLVAGIDVDAFLAGPEDSAEVEEFGAGIVSCAPDLLGATGANGTPVITPVPEPTATEPAADAQLSAAEVYARLAPSIVFIETPAGTGSGVLIDEGYIVTNRHVVWPYESVWVTFPDGAWYDDVPVIGWDALSDLAVLGPVETSVAPSELADGEGLAPGSELYLVGYPAETEISPRADHKPRHPVALPRVGMVRHDLLPDRRVHRRRPERRCARERQGPGDRHLNILVQRGRIWAGDIDHRRHRHH